MGLSYITALGNLPAKAQKAVNDAASGADWIGPAVVTPTGFYSKWILVPTDLGPVLATDRMILPSTAQLSGYSSQQLRVTENVYDYGNVQYDVRVPVSANGLTSQFMFSPGEKSQIDELDRLLSEGKRRASQLHQPPPPALATSVPDAPISDPPALARIGLSAAAMGTIVELQRTGAFDEIGELLGDQSVVDLGASIVRQHANGLTAQEAIVDELNSALISYIAHGGVSLSDIMTIMGFEDASGHEELYGLAAAASQALVGHPRFGGNEMMPFWRENDEMSAEFAVWSASAMIRLCAAQVIPFE